MEHTYPRYKFQGVPVQPGQHHTENPGFICQRVASPEEERALKGDWHDTPADAISAFNAKPAAPAHAAPEAHATHTAHAAHEAHTAHETEPEPVRHTKHFPTESEKRKRGR